MRRIHIVGGKNHGKTTLVVELVAEFVRRGLRVGTIKHTHHQHELDVPGKDSHKHREAGATVVGILTKSVNAVFWSNVDAQARIRGPIGDERYRQFEAAFSDCDLVIVEGDTMTAAPKLEVWRAAPGTVLLAESLTNVLAIVSDDSPMTQLPIVARHSIAAVADFVVNVLES
jgi:molybdopterin-guanine dinucleotide biosynthesis protein MobB